MKRKSSVQFIGLGVSPPTALPPTTGSPGSVSIGSTELSYAATPGDFQIGDVSGDMLNASGPYSFQANADVSRRCGDDGSFDAAESMDSASMGSLGSRENNNDVMLWQGPQMLSREGAGPQPAYTAASTNAGGLGRKYSGSGRSTPVVAMPVLQRTNSGFSNASNVHTQPPGRYAPQPLQPAQQQRGMVPNATPPQGGRRVDDDASMISMHDLLSSTATHSWYSPAQRRAGLGAARRNQLLYRNAALGNLHHVSDDDNSSIDSDTFSEDETSLEEPRRRREHRHHRHAAMSDSSPISSDGELRKVGRADQLFAVMERSTRQLWRRKLDLFLEIAVPLVFIAVSIALWAVFGDEHNQEMDWFPSVPSDGTEGYTNYYLTPQALTGVCYSSDDPTLTVKGGTSCRAYTVCEKPASDDAPCEYVCDGDYSQIPVPGLRFCRLKFYDWLSIYFLTVQPYYRFIATVPDMDNLLTTQWIALSAQKAAMPLIVNTMSGITANTRFSAVLCSGNVYFVGSSSNTAAVEALVTHLNATSTFFHYVNNGNVFSSVAAAKAAVAATDRLWAIVELRQMDANGLDLVLHMNNSALPSFGTTYDDAYGGGVPFDAAELYPLSGFLTLHKLIADYYVNTFHNAAYNTTHYLAALATPAYTRKPLLINARDVLPLIYALAFLYSVTQQVKRTVLEKELRIRESMLIMGLKQWTLYVSDFLIQVFIFVITCICCTLMLKLTYVTKSDPLVLFLIFFVFSLTTIPLSGIIAAFCSQSRLASLISPVVYFVLVIPMFAMSNTSGAIVIGFSVFSPSGFAAAMSTFLLHESGSGCGGGQLMSPLDDPTIGVLLAMLTGDFFIYYLLMLYLDAVVPKEWGTPKHPLFFVLDPIHWCCGTKAKRLEGGADGRAENGVFETTDYRDDVVSFEGLRKEYSRGGKKFVAVNNLYWGMREGEISVLLGHNGAGKTTVLNMMTGMTQPDAGDCYIYGHSVRMEKDAVRQQIGYCPQHNILWDELTCRDHLEFYGKIKGLKGWELEDAICRMLYETDLLEKMDQPAGSLSGGMKRKLSIAVAFVGGSRLVFLDEPTAGLDVGARRQVWELLKRMATTRTLLLTTHYMDEADLLGSRIGIMSQGRLKCTGSSLFLKSRLGVGYSIVISVDPEIDPTGVDDVVTGAVAGATVLGHNGCELSYQLPMESVDQFPALLNEIDSVEADGIRGYSLAATTLEEVFLKVSEEDLDYRGKGKEEGNVELIWNCEVRSSVLASQFSAMMAKRFWNALRDRRMQCFQIVCPVLCILIAMLLSLVQYRDPQTLTYNYDMFGKQPASTVYTSQCDEVWGAQPLTNGKFNVKETNYASGLNISFYTLDTWYVHNEPRYGAISCNDAALRENLTAVQRRNIYVSTVFVDPHTPVSLMMYNSSSHHQAGLNQVAYYDLMLKHLTGGSDHFMKTAVTLFKPPPSTTPLSFVFIGALIMVPFTFLPSNPVAWVVKERQCGSRHLQNLCGLNFFVYWGATFIFDMCAYFLVMLLCITIFAIFQRTEFIATDRVGGTFVLFIVYGFTSTAFGYCLSFLFKESATAQTVVMGVSFVAGFLLLMIVYILTLDDTTIATADKMRWGFRVIPSYCIGEGLINILQLNAKVTIGTAKGVWDMDQLGWSLVYMAAEFPAFIIITLLIDHPAVSHLLRRLHYSRNAEPIVPSDEDSDVEDEREAVYEAESDAEDSTDVVRVVNLQKKYSTGNIAVKGITFSIFPGEVFGFLGTNGAGKTTTISMLCQQFLPTGGSAYVCGYDVVKQSKEALQCIGYCPQFDATLDLLTVEEQLQLYAGIRGIEKAQWEELIDALCTLCELTMYRKTVTNELSGGNRRKLSVAMSLVGGPQVLFLDEPSAGMDPVARRGMWTAIQRASRHCSVVLTTHHLEEVEALADTVAIMMRGAVQCFGDKVHLKNKFGSAFELGVLVASPFYGRRLERFVATTFPGAVCNEGDGRRFVYRLPRDRPLGAIFEVVQRHKEQLHITDYSVSQTSMEQIFLQVEKRASARETKVVPLTSLSASFIK